MMENPIAKVSQGKLRGINEKNINGLNFFAFRGVPYAKPPIGNLRFKDCEPLESWFDVRDAVKFGNRCAQKFWSTEIITGNDDCLYLNVYTPSLNSKTPKAVMVWIHGGAFVCGSGEDDMYGPDYLIENDIVLVTINYRIGILGFLNVDDEEAPGNQGLKDQVEALKWIQQNIAQFDGDPNNVTIFGESAGGASVHYLTLSPLAKGLFHKAIIQSGVAVNPWASASESPMKTVEKLAAVLNKDISDIKEFVNYLRTLDSHRLIEAETKIRTNRDKILFIHPFIPTVDLKAKNPFLIKSPEEAAKDGIQVCCMCGYVSHEGIVIAGGMNDDIYSEIDADIENLLIHPIVVRYLKKYNVSVDDVKQYYFDEMRISSENNDEIVEALGAIHFVIGIHNVIEIQRKISNVSTYLYKFEYEMNDSLIKKILGSHFKGTCHGDELSFLFHMKLAETYGKQPLASGTIQHCLIQRFTKLWTNFAKTGNPTPEQTDLIPVEWAPVDNSKNEYNCMHITDELIMATETNITKQLIKALNDKP